MLSRIFLFVMQLLSSAGGINSVGNRLQPRFQPSQLNALCTKLCSQVPNRFYKLGSSVGQLQHEG